MSVFHVSPLDKVCMRSQMHKICCKNETSTRTVFITLQDDEATVHMCSRQIRQCNPFEEMLL